MASPSTTPLAWGNNKRDCIPFFYLDTLRDEDFHGHFSLPNLEIGKQRMWLPSHSNGSQDNFLRIIALKALLKISKTAERSVVKSPSVEGFSPDYIAN